ncbi:MAG: hypothetical protein ACI8SR_003232 [Oceanicoccus sp.]|jgi:hypothetical protein
MRVSLILTIILTLFCHQSHSEERDDFDRAVDAVEFKTKISGTTWYYQWEGKNFIFAFEPDGSISKLESWAGVTWQATQKNEVKLTAKNGNMFLHFNDAANTFTTVDWNKEKASGELIFKDDR